VGQRDEKLFFTCTSKVKVNGLFFPLAGQQKRSYQKLTTWQGFSVLPKTFAFLISSRRNFGGKYFLAGVQQH